MSDALNPRLEKNLKALYQKNPLLAAQLKILEPNKKYEVYIGNDPLNINIYDKENKVALFSKEPLAEITQKIKEFEPFNAPINPYKKNPKFTPPQSFAYISKVLPGLE